MIVLLKLSLTALLLLFYYCNNSIIKNNRIDNLAIRYVLTVRNAILQDLVILQIPLTISNELKILQLQ